MRFSIRGCKFSKELLVCLVFFHNQILGQVIHYPEKSDRHTARILPRNFVPILRDRDPVATISYPPGCELNPNTSGTRWRRRKYSLEFTSFPSEKFQQKKRLTSPSITKIIAEFSIRSDHYLYFGVYRVFSGTSTSGLPVYLFSYNL